VLQTRCSGLQDSWTQLGTNTRHTNDFAVKGADSVKKIGTKYQRKHAHLILSIVFNESNSTLCFFCDRKALSKILIHVFCVRLTQYYI
jgi:hypothetical protein